MSRLAGLAGRHRGQRCVLIANGPSLNQMDLRFLRNEVTIGLNKIYLGFRKFSFYPRYYVAVNDLVIQQSADAIKAMNCVKFISERNAATVPEDALTYHINTSRPAQRFCKDISQGVHEGWTVTYAALQVAYHLGFSEVVIIGMDHRYAYSGDPNQMQTLEGDDPNHFSPAYFGGGQQWKNPDLARSEESYRIARETFDADGRRIIDATFGGACTVFEKAEYRSLFETGSMAT